MHRTDASSIPQSSLFVRSILLIGLGLELQGLNRRRITTSEHVVFLLSVSDVPMWLKSLRLHKYAALFSQMTYEEMMILTEHHLESQVCHRLSQVGQLLSLVLSFPCPPHQCYGQLFFQHSDASMSHEMNNRCTLQLYTASQHR